MNPKKYINTLFEKRLMRHEIKRIQSLAHQIGIYNINKFFLSFFDGKRYILNDGVKTLAYGHKGLKVLFRQKY